MVINTSPVLTGLKSKQSYHHTETLIKTPSLKGAEICIHVIMQ